MAVKTKAQILAEIASLLADNTSGDISASDVRTCLNDIVDSYFDAPYKKYVALLTQSGTSAPVATILENTLGGTPTLTYGLSGVYNAELIGGFPNGKTVVIIGGNSASSSAIFTTNRYDEDNIEIRSYAGGLADDLLLETSIEIRVYA